jgi:hypothetical protein
MMTSCASCTKCGSRRPLDPGTARPEFHNRPSRKSRTLSHARPLLRGPLSDAVPGGSHAGYPLARVGRIHLGDAVADLEHGIRAAGEEQKLLAQGLSSSRSGGRSDLGASLMARRILSSSTSISRIFSSFSLIGQPPCMASACAAASSAVALPWRKSAIVESGAAVPPGSPRPTPARQGVPRLPPP